MEFYVKVIYKDGTVKVFQDITNLEIDSLNGRYVFEDGDYFPTSYAYIDQVHKIEIYR